MPLRFPLLYSLALQERSAVEVPDVDLVRRMGAVKRNSSGIVLRGRIIGLLQPLNVYLLDPIYSLQRAYI